MPKEKTIHLALLGLGKLGTGFVRILKEKTAMIKAETGMELNLKKILIKNAHFNRPAYIDKNLLTTNVEDIIKDKSISIAIDAIGGIEPTFSIIKTMIENKIHLVSANRVLLASKMHELVHLANQNNVYIFPEASLGGGIPIINILQRDLVANKIRSLAGILSGTSNFILSEMTQRRLPMTEILKLPEIQNLAESLSVIDYEGADAAQKVAILAAAAFGINVNFLHIHAEGISDVSVDDIRYVGDLGYEIKLLAIIKDHPQQFEIRVHPTLVPKGHPFTAVRGEYTAVLVETDLLGDYIIHGKGVGIEASSSLIIRDIVKLANVIFNGKHNDPYRLDWNEKSVKPMDEIISSYYMRFPCHDRPGVIGMITTLLGKHKINIGSAHAEVDYDSPSRMGFVHILIDHAREKDVTEALADIAQLDIIRSRIKLYRIL
jgi:homoserine dehydrogenase